MKSHCKTDTYSFSRSRGFVKKTVLLMPLDQLEGIGPGCLVRPTGKSLTVKIDDTLLGHTLDGLGRPLDMALDLESAPEYPVSQDSPDPFRRQKIAEIMPTGVPGDRWSLDCWPWPTDRHFCRQRGR